uniref:Macaca fascicularis brain cDNA clone: QflA-16023, similar to human solute carrier family 35, member F1 (SLC35F1), mRNA, RefSeq: XM_167044.4 n=1 Tax=Macaca fascicularis TaxID=9541 RepID=I7G4V8_MACFA|nr:unnamed protein product [Macaca fascicularis]
MGRILLLSHITKHTNSDNTADGKYEPKKIYTDKFNKLSIFDICMLPYGLAVAMSCLYNVFK